MFCYILKHKQVKCSHKEACLICQVLTKKSLHKLAIQSGYVAGEQGATLVMGGITFISYLKRIDLVLWYLIMRRKRRRR